MNNHEKRTGCSSCDETMSWARGEASGLRNRLICTFVRITIVCGPATWRHGAVLRLLDTWEPTTVLLHIIYKLSTNVWSVIARATKFCTILIMFIPLMFIHFPNIVYNCQTKHSFIAHNNARCFGLNYAKLSGINLKKGKAFPLQAWTGPWGSRRLRLQNF